MSNYVAIGYHQDMWLLLQVYGYFTMLVIVLVHRHLSYIGLLIALLLCQPAEQLLKLLMKARPQKGGF